jgi:signal transduction histidine kinase
MTPRVERGIGAPPERRALQDALAWPIAALLLLGAAIVFILPRFVPSRFLPVAVGAVFALTTITLVALLAVIVERWLKRHAAAMAVDAERQVQTVGVAGLPTATGDGALIPLASAFADAGARAALRAAEREANELLAQVGTDLVARSGQVLATLREAAPAAQSDAQVTSAVGQLDALNRAVQRLTAPVPTAVHAVDVVAEARTVVGELDGGTDVAPITTIFDVDHGSVLIDRARLALHLRELLMLAQASVPPDGMVTLHVSKIFRANIEETPVRRTGDSRLTIVPRASGDALRAWVLRAQPGAEVLSIVITDTGPTPSPESQQRAFEAFAVPRQGDPFGVTLATVRRTVTAARGTIWIDGAREGGTAVHLLLPIATS